MLTGNPVAQNFNELYGRLRLPVIIFDMRGVLLNANAAFCELAEVTDGSLENYNLLSFFKQLKSLFERGWQTGALPHQETLFTTSQAREFPVRLHYTLVTCADGTIAGCLAFVLDMRELSGLRERLEKLCSADGLPAQTPDGLVTEKRRLERDLTETRSVLENVLESCGDGIFAVNSNGQITLANEAFGAMLGKSRQEIEGLHVYELGPMAGEYELVGGEPVVLDRSYAHYQRGQLEKMQELVDGKGGKIEGWEFYAFHKNGRLVPFELTSSIGKNPQGELLGMVTSARDLTARRTAEQTIKRARDFLEKVIEASYDAIVVSTMDGMILLANSALGRLAGLPKEAFIGKRVTDVMPFEQAEAEMGKHLHEELFQKGYLSFESDFRRADGLVHLEHTITIIHDDGGSQDVSCIVSVIRDITEKRKDALELQNAYRLRSEFFTNITHAFRTPLTLSIGPVEGILRGEFGSISPDITGQLAMVLRNSRHLLKLIDQLLDFGRLESGKRDFVYETRDLKQFISTILDSFSFIARKKKINMTCEAPGTVPPVSIDPVKMEKVLFNIIGNAVKFTPDGGSITVALESDACTEGLASGRCVKISIADTGIGIAQDELGTIFDRFIQAGAPAAQRQAGSGIGLAHAKELMEAMGGKITAASTPGKGSTFSVYIPVPQQQSNPLSSDAAKLHCQPEVETSDIMTESAPAPDCVSGTKPVVLVVDDNPDVLKFVSDIVKREYDFMTAGSGAEAFDKMKKHPPDLILCDIMMPGMDGYGFMQLVKAEPGFQMIPFIFLTARADTEMKIEGLEFGADDYIVKPFNSLELLARVKSLLRLRELMRTASAQKHTIDSLTQKLAAKFSYGSIIGSSPGMRAIYQLIETVSDSDATVLITGETGTGKELIANAIHYSSSRKTKPMISVNCGAIPRELMEREFFGHVKGAYTGATENRKGYFQQADGGTLFLDEIGELHRDMQVKLLRVLERGEINRVGDPAAAKVNVRLIVATNKDLRAEVRNGDFREDLFYRIYVVPVHVPPLRERQEDISLLAEHFLEEFKKKMKRDVQPLSQSDMKSLMQYGYPGNVRELQHIIERYCLLGTSITSLLSQPSTAAAGPFPYDELLSSSNPLKEVGQRAKTLAERDLIMHVLGGCDNNYTDAARMLNIGLSSLYRKLQDSEE